MSKGKALRRIEPDGSASAAWRQLAEEVPVAISLNGIGYAVLMATPADVDDLVAGFLLSERLIDAIEDLVASEVEPSEAGILVRVTLVERCAARVVDRVRHRASDSSCGLCGVENLEQALRPLPAVTAQSGATEAAIFAVVAALADHQPLSAATGAAHAAALCAADGAIRLVREDVGRHNAFDKLIGVMLRQRLEWDGGFALLTSRCSYELVEKAVLSGCPLLATISAPTALAVERAGTAGLPLRVLVRPDAMLAVP